MTALPPEVPERLRDLAHVVNAYSACLRYEKCLQLAVDEGEDVGNDLIYVRILGYLIHYVPTPRGLKTVVEEINSCVEDSELLDVGKVYYDHYIRAFQSNRNCVSTPSSAASRPSSDTIAERISDTLVDVPQSHADAKKNALIRDGYRCVVTGKYDTRSVKIIRELEDRVMSDPSARVEATQCAHIFAESTNSDTQFDQDLPQEYASTMWGVMRGLGYESLRNELHGSKVHRLENVLTLIRSLHMDFDQFDIWFVATTEKDKYRLEAAKDYILRDYPEYVIFTTPDQAKLPVPSPTYLAIHAACARVAHLSGAAECIDKFYQDMNDSTTLDPDGASAGMLEHAIFKL